MTTGELITVRELLTSPEMPRYIRLPGLFSLIRAWVLFTILTLQVANLWPVDSTWLHDKSYGRVINRVGHWAGEMQMEKVCWQVFLSVCTGLICSGLANGLDRGYVEMEWFRPELTPGVVEISVPASTS